jgi:hypothetical protein
MHSETVIKNLLNFPIPRFHHVPLGIKIFPRIYNFHGYRKRRLHAFVVGEVDQGFGGVGGVFPGMHENHDLVSWNGVREMREGGRRGRGRREEGGEG